jgi:hypothetical protein
VPADDVDGLAAQEPGDDLDRFDQPAGAIGGDWSLPADVVPFLRGVAGTQTQQHPSSNE